MKEQLLKRKQELIQLLAQAHIDRSRADEAIKRLEAAYQEVERTEKLIENEIPPPQGS